MLSLDKDISIVHSEMCTTLSYTLSMKECSTPTNSLCWFSVIITKLNSSCGQLTTIMNMHTGAAVT